MKLCAKGGRRGQTEAAERAFWRLRSEFTGRFGNPEFPSRFQPQVEFLGVWDTVKSVGWLNWRAQLEQARWPFTRKVSNARVVRHALALDERRRPYGDYRFDADELAAPGGRVREVWFAGAHSDVGGTFADDHARADITLKWMADEAIAAGLAVDPTAYRRRVSVSPAEELPADHCLGRIHANGLAWAVVGLGWHRRRVRPGDEVHPSVRRRVAATRTGPRPYAPAIPEAAAPVAPERAAP